MSNYDAPKEVKAEIEAFTALDKTHRIHLKGLRNPKIENFGVYKRYTYNVKTTADYQVLLNFINAWHKSSVRVGIEKMAMKYARLGLLSQFQLVMYVNSK